MAVMDTIKKWGIKNYRVIDKQAITEITLGASILATGGGGDPEIGLLWAYKVIEEGNEIILVDPLDVPDDIFVASPSPLGSALVLTEKPLSYDILSNAINGLEKYTGKKLNGIIPVECGGVASIVAYATAGKHGVPVIDVDGMNRAFPEIQMTSWHTHGISATPMVSADDRGYITVIDTKGNDNVAELIARRTSMSYGGISWVALYPMSGKDLKATSILNSQSIAWDLGKAVLNARKKHFDPIEELLKAFKRVRNLDGYKIFDGKMVDINRDFGSEASKGFTMGKVVMEGINEYKGSVAELDFQNEWLIVKVDGIVKCLTPDLIAILDSETGEPIRTDIMKYGYRGTIIVLPASERMRTPKGIDTFGPRYFGYDLDYVSVEELNRK